MSGASYPGDAGQPQSHSDQSGHLRGQSEMEDTAKVISTKIGGEKLKKQTQTRVRLFRK